MPFPGRLRHPPGYHATLTPHTPCILPQVAPDWAAAREAAERRAGAAKKMAGLKRQGSKQGGLERLGSRGGSSAALGGSDADA